MGRLAADCTAGPPRVPRAAAPLLPVRAAAGPLRAERRRRAALRILCQGGGEQGGTWRFWEGIDAVERYLTGITSSVSNK